MKLLVSQITESPKEASFSEATGELNLIYGEGKAADFCFPPSIDVHLTYYRSGRELFFQGSIEGNIEGYCSRCLKSYVFPLEKSFDFVLTPDPFSVKKKELNWEEMGLSFYSEEEINLSPFIREQMLLALPTRPLCGDDCRGLCAGCGADLNHESCRCPSSASDPRMAPFRNMKLDQ